MSGAQRWERVRTLFHEALERPPAERSAFLRAQNDDDGDIWVAIKLLAPDLAGDSRNRERFEREARLLSKVIHGRVELAGDAQEAATMTSWSRRSWRS